MHVVCLYFRVLCSFVGAKHKLDLATLFSLIQFERYNACSAYTPAHKVEIFLSFKLNFYLVRCFALLCWSCCSSHSSIHPFVQRCSVCFLILLGFSFIGRTHIKYTTWCWCWWRWWWCICFVIMFVYLSQLVWKLIMWDDSHLSSFRDSWYRAAVRFAAACIFFWHVILTSNMPTHQHKRWHMEMARKFRHKVLNEW